MFVRGPNSISLELQCKERRPVDYGAINKRRSSAQYIEALAECKFWAGYDSQRIHGVFGEKGCFSATTRSRFDTRAPSWDFGQLDFMPVPGKLPS